MKKIDHYYQVLNRVDGMLNFAEAKIGFIIAYIGLLLSVLGTQADGIKSLLHNPSIWMISLTLAFLILMLVVVFIIFVYLYKVLFPRLTYSSHPSMAYFGDVSSLAENDFLDMVEARSGKDLAKDILTQIHAVSNIVNHKFVNIQKASWWLYPFTGLWIGVMILIILFS